MKTIPGKIVITDKVYFEPDGSEKPDKDNYNGYGSIMIFNQKIKAYEASKQKVEVENVFRTERDAWTPIRVYDTMNIFNGEEVISNQSCTAEIKGNKATIISLNK